MRAYLCVHAMLSATDVEANWVHGIGLQMTFFCDQGGRRLSRVSERGSEDACLSQARREVSLSASGSRNDSLQDFLCEWLDGSHHESEHKSVNGPPSISCQVPTRLLSSLAPKA
jgi:hypothetical protein